MPFSIRPAQNRVVERTDTSWAAYSREQGFYMLGMTRSVANRQLSRLVVVGELRIFTSSACNDA
jgi:hypothetical protein